MELCEATQGVKGSAFLTYALRQRHSAMRLGPSASIGHRFCCGSGARATVHALARCYHSFWPALFASLTNSPCALGAVH